MTEYQDLEYQIPDRRQFEQLIHLISQSLHFPRLKCRKAMEKLGRENYRCLVRDNRPVGGLGFLSMGQFFGGNSVETAGVVAVGIPPQLRGRGVGAVLMKKALLELREKNVPISVLYPSTVAFYQKFGYVIAGHQFAYEMCLPMIPPAKSSLKMIPAPDVIENLELYREIYNIQARCVNGNLDRSSFLWEWFMNPYDKEVFRYQVLDRGKATGYVIYTQGCQGESIKLLDVCALSRETALGILEFFRGHGTITASLFWSGGPGDQLLKYLPNAGFKVSDMHFWMIRMVNPALALEQRGYPRGLAGTLHLKITDGLIPENNTCLQVEFNQGRARVTPGGKGLVTLSVEQLGSLFTSFTSPEELSLTDPLEGDPDQLDLLGQAFSGPAPWMRDMF